MNVFVVIPNWNEAKLLDICLQALNNQTINHKVVVVDNGSVDDSLKILEQYPDIHVIKNVKNMGFTGGVNPGIKYAIKNNADAVALINNDAKPEKSWLKNLVETLKIDKSIGIATSKIMLEDKKHLDSTGDFYSIYGIPFPRGRNQVDKGQFDKLIEVFGASGGGSIYRTAMLKEIGLFDDRFFAYYEDVDISFRAQLAGWRINYQPKAIVYHKLSATSSKMGNFARYHSIKNFFILYTKNMPLSLYFKYLPKYLYQLSRTFARSVIDLQLFLFLRAFFKFLTILPGILIDRRKIQSSRKISIKELDDKLYKSKPNKIPVIEIST